MLKLIFGILIVLGGIGGCVTKAGISGYQMAKKLQEIQRLEKYNLNLTNSDFTAVKKDLSYYLYFAAQAEHEGKTIVQDADRLPKDTLVLLDDQGKRYELDLTHRQPMNAKASHGPVKYSFSGEFLGSIRLKPGNYRLKMPQDEPPLVVTCLPFDAMGLQKRLAKGVTIGLAIFGVGFIVGLVFIILGIVSLAKGKKRARPIYDD